MTQGAGEVNTLPGTPAQLEPADGSTDLPIERRVPLDFEPAFDSLWDSDFDGLDICGRVRRQRFDRRRHCAHGFGSGVFAHLPLARVWEEREREGTDVPIWRLATAGSLPGAVLLTAPEDQAAVVSDSVLFTWEPGQPDADRYWFELGFDAAFTFRVLDSSLMDTRTVARGLVKNHTYYWRVKARNGMGWGPFSDVRSVQTTLTGVVDGDRLPEAFALRQNYPNPFNPETTIEYTIAGAGIPGSGASKVTLAVFDLLGREVARLIDGVQPPGAYSVRFAPSNLAGGLYVYRLEVRPLSGGSTGSFSAARSLVLLK